MRVAATISLALLFSLPLPAQAGADARIISEAKRRFDKGNQQYQEGNYEQALRLYFAAYELVPLPDILFNIGLAQEKVLDYEACALSFRRYLDETAASGPGAARDRAQERFDACRKRAAIPVRISSIPPGAAIALGRAELQTFRGRTPAELELTPATYRISVDLPGYLPLSQDVVVDVGLRPQVDFPLEKLSVLTVEADVSGAEVAVNDGPPAPAPLRRELRAGVYRVRVTKPGHRAAEREIRVDPGESSTLMVSLPRLEKRRGISIEATPAVIATVRIDGKLLGTAPVRYRARLGAHELTVTAPGHVSFAGRIALEGHLDASFLVRLEPVRTRRENAVFWGLVGTAGATAAAGSLYGLLALYDQSDFGDTPSLALAERGDRRALRADILFGTAAASMVGALIYRLVTRPKSSRVERR